MNYYRYSSIPHQDSIIGEGNLVHSAQIIVAELGVDAIEAGVLDALTGAWIVLGFNLAHGQCAG